MAYQDYDAFNNGKEADAFLKKSDGSIYKGRVWPGATAFPDWFHENTQDYWDNEFEMFFSPDTGVDIDALFVCPPRFRIRLTDLYRWIDMNEPSNFCEWPCENPDEESAEEMQMRIELQLDPTPPVKRDAQHGIDAVKNIARQSESAPKMGLPGRNLTLPSYQIRNTFGAISNKTIDTDLVHQGGWVEYDTHNL